MRGCLHSMTNWRGVRTKHTESHAVIMRGGGRMNTVISWQCMAKGMKDPCICAMFTVLLCIEAKDRKCPCFSNTFFK